MAELAPPLVSVSFGPYERHVERLKQAGSEVATQVGTVAEARDAEQAGVDLIVARGGEGGGRQLPGVVPLDELGLDGCDVPGGSVVEGGCPPVLGGPGSVVGGSAPVVDGAWPCCPLVGGVWVLDDGVGCLVVEEPPARSIAAPTEVRAWPLSRAPSAVEIGSLIAASIPLTAPIAIAKISAAAPTTTTERRHGHPIPPPARGDSPEGEAAVGAGLPAGPSPESGADAPAAPSGGPAAGRLGTECFPVRLDACRTVVAVR